jgi:hypothetical protein
MIKLLADMIWPALFVEGRLLSSIVIGVGLVIEFFFVWRFTGRSVWWSIGADLAMNTASTLLGIILIPVAGIIWEFFPGMLLYDWFKMGTFNPLTWSATFVIAVVINAAVETFVVAKLLRQPMGRRGFGWLCVANACSVGLAYASFWVYPIPRG